MARRPKKRVAKRPVRGRRTRRAHTASAVVPPPPRRLHNIPTQLTSFIGREQEIAEIKRLLATTRLLTLTGSGGCGKTRLALRVAGDLRDQYPDGVWFVELAPLTDPAFVPNAVASALGVPEAPTRPLTETLASHLEAKNIFLVLDNCEHVLAATQNLIDRLLRASATVQMLATSREVLGVEGELTYRVPSLRLPEIRQGLAAAELTKYDAISLFVDRAALVQPEFALTERNAQPLTQICRRLDGMPLAIELAAARVRTLSVEQVAARLDDRFHLLTAGTRQTVPRQQTLRATMDWSYELLSESQRALLRRLVVFADGWTLEAAESVCVGGGVEASLILDLLTQLVDKSLVVVETGAAAARYSLLETVRQYGRFRLAEAGEAEAVAGRHRDWFLALAERAGLELRRPEQVVWLDRLETEHDNMRAALEWSKTEKGGAEAEASLAGALWWFWFLRGHWTEGRRWLDHIMTTKVASPSALVKVLEGAAFFAWRQNDFPQATALTVQGVTLCQQLDDKEGLTWFYHHLGVIASRQGGYQEADRHFNRGLSLAREVGDPWLISLLLAHHALPKISQQDYESAEPPLAESLTIARKIGDRFLIAFVLYNQGYLFLGQKDWERATGVFTESLTLSRDLRDWFISHECLEGLAGVTCAQGHRRQTALLLGAADALRTTTGHRFSVQREREHERYVAAACAALGDAAYATAWVEGRGMALEQAISYALEGSIPTESKAAIVSKHPAETVDLLTAREQEVVVLVARGLTNRQIAAKLVVTERTIEVHVHNILNKLDFTSRTQIAAWAVERGLRTLAVH